MHKFIAQVDRHCKTDANDSVNGVPVAHKLYLTGSGGKQITNMQRIVAFKKAYALWHTTYLAEDDKGYYVLGFKSVWNSTIKKADLDRYGWNAN